MSAFGNQTLLFFIRVEGQHKERLLPYLSSAYAEPEVHVSRLNSLACFGRVTVHQRYCLQPAAEEEDSYTKEETKTPRFVNLVHAASLQKQQGLPGQAGAANEHTPRSGAYASEDAFAQQSVEQLERSGLVTSSLPEPLEQQVRTLSLFVWSFGGSLWANLLYKQQQQGRSSECWHQGTSCHEHRYLAGAGSACMALGLWRPRPAFAGASSGHVGLAGPGRQHLGSQGDHASAAAGPPATPAPGGGCAGVADTGRCPLRCSRQRPSLQRPRCAPGLSTLPVACSTDQDLHCNSCLGEAGC